MPIVDNELFSLAPVRPEPPAVAAGRLYRQQIQENLQKHGDGTWIVCSRHTTNRMEKYNINLV